MLITEAFKDYVLRNINKQLRKNMYYAYNNGLNIDQVKKGIMDADLLEGLKKWFKENGVIEYV